MTLYAEFASSLEVCAHELCLMDADHKLWKALNDQLGARPWIGEPGDFFEFMTDNHFVAFGIKLRRLLDIRGRRGSLSRIIRDVADCEILFHRDRFVRSFRDAGFPTDEYADGLFSRLAHSETSPVYPSALAQRHLNKLHERFRPIRAWVNRRVAHLDPDKANPVVVIRYGQVLRYACRLQETYCLLSTGSTARCEGDFLLSENWRQPLTRGWFGGA